MVFLVLAGGCGAENSEVPDLHVSQSKDSFILYADGYLGSAPFIRLEYGETDSAVLFSADPGRLRHAGIPPDVLELIHVPEDWKTVFVLKSNPDKPDPSRAVSTSDQPFKPVPKNTYGSRGWVRRHLFVLLVYGFLIFYTIMVYTLASTHFAGEGGQALFIGHIVGFLALAGEWERLWFYLYLVLLIAASVLYIRARGEEQDFKKPANLIIFIVYIFLCLGMFGIVLTDKEYVPRARWSSPQGISLYIPPSERGQIELIDTQEQVLGSFSLEPGLKTNSLLIWKDPVQVPAAIRIMREGDTIRVLKLDNRPEKNPET